MWTHGLSDKDHNYGIPIYIPEIRLGNWDTYRFNRKYDSDFSNFTVDKTVRLHKRAIHRLSEIVDELHKKGYKKVVLAGQSAGAWLSLKLSTKKPIYAVIGTAAATFGYKRYRYKNASSVRGFIKQSKAQKILLFYFAKDKYNPNPEKIMRKAHKVANKYGIELITYGLEHSHIEGHGAANTHRFADNHKDMILNFLDTK